MSENKKRKITEIDEDYELFKEEFLKDADRMGLTHHQKVDEKFLRSVYEEFLADDGHDGEGVEESSLKSLFH